MRAWLAGGPGAGHLVTFESPPPAEYHFEVCEDLVPIIEPGDYAEGKVEQHRYLLDSGLDVHAPVGVDASYGYAGRSR